VDTLILHAPSADPAAVLAAAEEAANSGTVLVITKRPAGRTWNNLIEL
jgi:hypothetical protein